MYMKRQKKQSKEYKGSYPSALAGKMSYDEAALFLDVSKRTLQKRVKAGTVPHYRIGHRVYFSEGQLLEWIESCKRGGDNGTTGA